MSGLLKQLQKPKTKLRGSSDLLLTSVTQIEQQSPMAPSGGGNGAAAKKHSKQSSADDIFNSYNPEDDRLITGGAPSGQEGSVRSTAEVHPEKTQLKIVRRKKAAQASTDLIGKPDDKLPWWLSDGKQTTPQIELLVPQARKMLNEILPSDGEAPVDLGAAVEQAVDLASQILSSEIRITETDKERAIDELLSLLTGKGPVQPLYDDPAVTDIFIDNHKSIKVIRRGKALETPFYYRSKEEYRAFVMGMLQSVDRVLNLSSPIVDCVLNDDWRSRINAVDATVVDGDEPRICIRVPRLQKVSFYDILQTKTLPATVAAWLAELVGTGEANILVLGATGSGKTVMTTALLSAVGSDERIITIEDVPEIFVPSAHLEKLVSRAPNAQGQGEIKMAQLLRAALRRAPHRIVVGEIRDEEGRLFLRALETGHAGSIATIHAHSPRDSLWRLLDLVQAYETSPQESIMRRIGRALHILIVMKKVDGRPCLTEIAEVHPPVQGEFVVQPLVKFEGLVDGRRQWRIMTKHSFWLDYLAARGMDLRVGPGLLDVNSAVDERSTATHK